MMKEVVEMEDMGLSPNSFFLLFLLEKWRMNTLCVVLDLMQHNS